MSTESVLMENHRGVAVITLNRPDELNTFDTDMINTVGQYLRQCDEDDAVRVVVLTGSGKAFCAGADLSAGASTFDEKEDMSFSSCALSMQPWEVRKPVIAACNGHAIGVGLSTALMCDMRVFAEEGKYGLLQNRRGVVADNVVEYLLPRLMGFERAFELIVRAVRLSGTEAKEWGLASRVTPAQDVLSTAMEIAEDMAVNCSPLVMAMHKRLLWQGLDMQREAFVDLETRALHYSMGREDAVEGGMAFFEKREPQWSSSVSRDWPDFLND
ncbi:MAG: enoyl-CoA hydratase/isomerase family protein [Halioglobus sp.]